MKYLLFLFLLFNGITQAQIVTIKVFDDTLLVPFVSMYEKNYNLYKSSDSMGCIKMKANNYDITLSHVSYKKVFLQISKSSFDTLVNIHLEKIISDLDDITILTKSNYELSDNEYTIGNYDKKTKMGIELRQSLKVGVRIAAIKNEKINILRNIKYKLKKNNGFVNSDFAEVKLFQISDGHITQNTLNKKPIYIKCSDLKKKNTLAINERIVIPKEGFFISFEMPAIYDTDNARSIVFYGTWLDGGCELFIQKNNNSNWDERTLELKKCLQVNDKFFALNVGITYGTLIRKKIIN